MGGRDASLKVELRRKIMADVNVGHVVLRGIEEIEAGLRDQLGRVRILPVQSKRNSGQRTIVGRSEVRSGIPFVALGGAGDRDIIRKPGLGEDVFATCRQASNHFEGPADLGVVADRTSASIRGRRISARCRAIDPAIAVVVEVGIQAANIEPASIRQLVVGTARETEALAVVAVFAEIDSGDDGRDGSVERLCVESVLDIVDTSSVPVIARTEENAKLFLYSKTLTNRAIHFSKRAASVNRRIAADAVNVEGGPLAGGLGDQIH